MGHPDWNFGPWCKKCTLAFNFVKEIFFPLKKGAITSDDGEYKAGYDLDSSPADFDNSISSNSTAKAQFSSLEYQDADVPNILPKVIRFPFRLSLTR